MKKLLLPALIAAVALSGCGRPADSSTRAIPDTPQSLADELWASLEGTDADRVSEISIQLKESVVTQQGDDLGPSGIAGIKGHPEGPTQKTIQVSPTLGLDSPGGNFVYEDESVAYTTRPALPAREAVDAAAADWFAAREAMGECAEPVFLWQVNHRGSGMSTLQCGIMAEGPEHRRVGGQAVELPADPASGDMLLWLLGQAQAAGAEAVSYVGVGEFPSIAVSQPSAPLVNGEQCPWQLSPVLWETTCNTNPGKDIPLADIDAAALAAAIDSPETESASLSGDIMNQCVSLHVPRVDGSSTSYRPSGEEFDPVDVILGKG